jgi:heat shock protein HslJ
MKPRRLLLLVVLALLLAACRQAEPTSTPRPAATEPPPTGAPTEAVPTPTAPPPEPAATTAPQPTATPAASPLAGATWTWLDFTAADGSRQSPADPTVYTITFNGGGAIAVQADCNSGSGRHSINGQEISITVESLTLALCAPASLSDRFVLLLNQATSYELDGERLALNGPAGSMTLTSGEVPAPPTAGRELTDGPWHWLEFEGGDGTVTAPADPADYTLLFHQDGNVDILADCNSGFALYTVAGTSVAIDVQSMSANPCSQGSLSEQFLDWLEQSVTFVLEGNFLYLNLMADAGNLQFAPAAAAPPTAGDGQVAPDAVAIDLHGVAEFYEWIIVEATPYIAGAASGPSGLPRHLALTFDGDPAAGQRMIIVPAAAYESLWLDAGDPLIANAMPRLKADIAAGDGSLPLPILPPPAGSNDLAVKIGSLNLFQGAGLRFIGRTSQEPGPALAGGLNYYFQGFLIVDGTEQFVSLVYPLTTGLLPESAESLTAEQQALLANDYPAYLAQVSQLLEQAGPAAFEPHLDLLDGLAASLRVSPQGTGPGQAIQNIVWQWESFTDPATGPTAVADPTAYTVLFLPDGQVQIQADCNQAGGIYNTNGPAIGIVIGALTQADCGPGSMDDEFLRLLSAAALFFQQDGKLYIDLKYDSGTLQFAPGQELEVGSPPPPAVSGGSLPPDLVQMDLNGLAGSFTWQLVPGTAYGAGGAPAHYQVTFDGEEPAETGRRLLIFPVQPYIDLWNAAGDATIQRRVDILAGLLAARPEQPATYALLPPQTGIIDVAVRPAYLTFDRGLGSGLRFVGRTIPDSAPVNNDQLFYAFQGLTGDGQFYVSLFWPVAAAGFPDTAADVSPEDQSLLAADYNLYLQQVIATLEAVPAAGWQPALASLDALVTSLILRP